VRFAGFWIRTAGFIIDGIIVSMLILFLLEGTVTVGTRIGPVIFAGTAGLFNVPAMPLVSGIGAAVISLLVLISWLYSALATSSRYGGTLGKTILGLKVVDSLGNTLTFGHATIRFLAKILSGAIFFIGFFMIHFSREKQGLHDRFSGTFVVYKKAGTGPGGDNPGTGAVIR
jgi:uncharacterized RDD family membrane protein YckC